MAFSIAFMVGRGLFPTHTYARSLKKVVLVVRIVIKAIDKAMDLYFWFTSENK